MLEPPKPWEIAPPPHVRIPGYDGSLIRFTAAANPDSAAAGQQAMGVNLTISTPQTQVTYARLPVGPEFPTRLAHFLNRAAAHMGPASEVEPFRDPESGVSIHVHESTDFTATLQLTHTPARQDADESLHLEQLVPTTRAALITAAQEAENFTDRRESDEFPFRPPLTALPLDLLSGPSQKRLTGILLSGTRLEGDGEFLFVSHYVRLTPDAQGDVETALLMAHLPFCEIAIHGVYDDRHPWVLLTQLLPIHAETDIAKFWDPIDIAREDLHAALTHAATDQILGEGIATRDSLIDYLTNRGVTETLIGDWETGELAQASIAAIANIPLQDLAIGRLTGCAFPEIDHDCPKDVFSCAFTRWQEQLFNPPEGTST